MRTTASNRKIRVLLTAIRSGALVPRPEFQRRLVWTNNDKKRFLKTVLEEYPFPEIYIAAGDVDLTTGEGKELLVDGQQRITTLNQYFEGSEDLVLGRDIPTYDDLDEEQKRKFLDYDVVIRDLGNISLQEIKEVFQRINSTSYSLNVMELHNAIYQGELKQFAEKIASESFFEQHKVFSASEIRRMQDTTFVLTFIVTIMSTYFTNVSVLEEYLSRYNDEFEKEKELEAEIRKVLNFLEKCEFSSDSRVWKKADLFSVLVELHQAIVKDQLKLDARDVSKALNDFYEEVDDFQAGIQSNKKVVKYRDATIQGTNSRSSRTTRGKIIGEVIRNKALSATS